MMEERITKLEAASDSTVSTLAALENDMNDRFKHIEDELSELRLRKVDAERRFHELRVEIERRLGELARRLNACLAY